MTTEQALDTQLYGRMRVAEALTGSGWTREDNAAQPTDPQLWRSPDGTTTVRAHTVKTRITYTVDGKHRGRRLKMTTDNAGDVRGVLAVLGLVDAPPFLLPDEVGQILTDAAGENVGGETVVRNVRDSAEGGRWEANPMPANRGRVGRGAQTAPFWLPSDEPALHSWRAARPGRGTGGHNRPRPHGIAPTGRRTPTRATDGTR